MKDNTIKVSLAVSKRIKTAKDLSDFFAFMEKDWDYTEEDYKNDRVPTYSFAESEQERIDNLMGGICYLSGKYDRENIYRILKNTYSFKKEEARSEAINYQIDLSLYGCSYLSLAKHQERFMKIGKRYGLLKEFKENGIL